MSASSAATSTGCSARWRRTAYAADAEASRAHDGLRRLHDAIRTHLSRSLEEMRSFYAGRARELVDVLLARFDLHNVIAVLRAHAGTHRPAEEALPTLIDMGWLVGPLAHEILRAGRARRRRRPARPLHTRPRAGRRAARRLRRVRAHGGPRGAGARGRRRPRGARGRRAVGAGPDARTLLRFTRREIDERNLLIALRLRDAPAPGAEATLLAGGSIPLARFGAALRRCRAGRRRSDARPLGASGPGTRRCSRWATSGDLLGLERELQRRRSEAAAALFVAGDPLSIDVPIAFAAAKRSEARNLRLLGEAGARGIHPDTVRRELLQERA